jgi:hypothetical protein
MDRDHLYAKLDILQTVLAKKVDPNRKGSMKARDWLEFRMMSHAHESIQDRKHQRLS